MKKVLYFVCPTDCLETHIDRTFNTENYYFTSLGNNILHDYEMLSEVVKLIQVSNIRGIQFVISNQNRIVLDAIHNRDYSGIKGLDILYNEIHKQKEISEVLWKSSDHHFIFLSYYLRTQINELKTRLKEFHLYEIDIDGKIFYKDESAFRNIYPELISYESYCLN